MATTTLNPTLDAGALPTASGSIGGGQLWAGRVLSGLAILALGFDALGKLLRFKAVVEGTTQIGFSPDVIVPIGLALAVGVVLYAIPRVAPLGAVLITGFLGGAVCINVRMGNPLFTHVLAPIYVAVFVWGGLFLRDPRVRALFSRR